MAQAPRIITLSGHSGVGKTTVAKRLIDSHRNTQMVPSLTTREERPSDLLGEYTYAEQDWFDYCRRAELFLWLVERGNTSYGTLRSSVRDICLTASDVGIMILVPDTVARLRRFVADQYPDTRITSIFLNTPGDEVLHARLLERGETEASIKERAVLEHDWAVMAERAKTPFRFIDAGRDPTDLPRVINEIKQQLT